MSANEIKKELAHLYKYYYLSIIYRFINAKTLLSYQLTGKRRRTLKSVLARWALSVNKH